MFYDSFIGLCELRGVSPSKVLDALGISRGGLWRWKNGGQPRNEYKKQIADYFGVSVRELIEGEKGPEAIEEATDPQKAEVIEIMEALSPENREKLLELGRLYIDHQNKEK